MELIQKRLTDRRYFKLLEDEVQFRVKTPNEDIESKFRYEELGLETVTFVKKGARKRRTSAWDNFPTSHLLAF